MDRSSVRLRTIETHLRAGGRPYQDGFPVGGRALPNECAATCTVSYGRPAAPDTLFARPVQEQPTSSYLEALGVASQHVLGQRTPLPQVPSSSASEQEPPLFARPQVTFSGDDKTVQNKSNSASSSKLQSTGQHFAPKAFIQESEFGYVLHAVLPGIKAKDIVAELLPNRRLLISGVRFSFSEGEGQGMKDNSGMKIYHKISSDPFILSMKEEPILPYGRFKISWKLPKDADLESLRAKVEDGCLWVSVSKRS